jgi:Mlc titration factor MtfA (ptsG expression regulator)
MGYSPVVFGIFKRWTRRAVRERPFPEEWRAIVDKNVAMIESLAPDERDELEKLMLVFLDEKSFEGAGGLAVNDEMKVTIAAQACFLLLCRDTDIYPKLDSIVLYPTAYKTKKVESLGAGVVIEKEQARLGESWGDGLVVLSWDAVRSGTINATDGRNVVLHEFAHQLDQEDGVADGAPDRLDRSLRQSWAEVLGAEYADLRQHVHVGRSTDIDEYGATNPAEFFAVVTEMFFERGPELKNNRADLYAQLAAFYQQDPASRPIPKRLSRKERRAKKR